MVAVASEELAKGVSEEARRADLAAQDRLRKFHSRYSLRRMYSEQNALLLANLGRGERLLEIGAGIGNFLVDAVRDFRHVSAIEVGMETARTASQQAAAAHISLAPGEQLPYRDASFDCVVARGVLHHMADPFAGIREMHRVLKPGGVLAILEGNPASAYRRAILGLADAMGIEHEDTHYRHLFPDKIADGLRIFEHFQRQAVSGIFAPFAYVGFGGPRVWSVFSRFRRTVQVIAPNSFAWWLLWTARK